MKNVHDERGVLPILGVVLIVALIAVIGVAIYSVNKPHDKTKTVENSPLPSSPRAPTGTASQTPVAMLVIRELGAEVPLTGGPSGLAYTYHAHPAAGAAAVGLGTKSSIGSGTCNYSIGEIVKFNGAIPDGVHPYTMTDASGHTINALLEQFNGFYLQYVPAQNPCTLADGSPFPDKTTSLQTVNAVNELQLTQ